MLLRRNSWARFVGTRSEMAIIARRWSDWRQQISSTGGSRNIRCRSLRRPQRHDVPGQDRLYSVASQNSRTSPVDPLTRYSPRECLRRVKAGYEGLWPASSVVFNESRAQQSRASGRTTPTASIPAAIRQHPRLHLYLFQEFHDLLTPPHVYGDDPRAAARVARLRPVRIPPSSWPPCRRRVTRPKVNVRRSTMSRPDRSCRRSKVISAPHCAPTDGPGERSPAAARGLPPADTLRCVLHTDAPVPKPTFERLVEFRFP